MTAAVRLATKADIESFRLATKADLAIQMGALQNSLTIRLGVMMAGMFATATALDGLGQYLR